MDVTSFSSYGIYKVELLYIPQVNDKRKLRCLTMSPSTMTNASPRPPPARTGVLKNNATCRTRIQYTTPSHEKRYAKETTKYVLLIVCRSARGR